MVIEVVNKNSSIFKLLDKEVCKTCNKVIKQ